MDEQKGQLLKQLQSALGVMGLSVSAQAQEKLIEFLYFLKKWNHAYNLTAIHALEGMLSHHVLDSLTVLPHLEGKQVLDVGTGAGFPGIPLAMVCLEKDFTLLDSGGKKIRFLRQAVQAFALENVRLEHTRMENFMPPCGFDVIICRAVGKMAGIIASTQSLLSPRGRWLFMKGTYPQDELNGIDVPVVVHSLQIPGVSVERHLVVVTNPP